MTIRLLCPYGKYPVNAIVTLDGGTEVGLIATKQASLDLTGGVPYAPQPLPNQQSAVMAVRDGTGNLLGMVDNVGAVAGGAGGGASDIAFSTSIPLTSGGVAYMPPQVVAGPLVLSPAAAAVRNSMVYLRLTANGQHVPTFANFAEWGTSLGWDNTAGVVNQVQFFYDGVDAFYSISQAVATATVPGDTTAPVRQSATINGATLTLAYNEALASAAPAASSFSLVLNGGTAVAPTNVAVSGQNVVLTFATAALQGQTATLSYAPGTNPIRDAAGNAAVAFSAVSVTNSTPASDTTAPVIQSAAINGGTLVMTYNETLNSAAPTLSAFTLSLAGGAGAAPTAAVVSGATVTLTFATAATAGQSAALSYNAGASAIRDAAGNNAANLTAYSVANNTAATGASAPLKFTNNDTYYTEAVDANGDYTYSSTSAIGSGYQAVAAMSAAKSLPAGTDGGFWFTSSGAASLNTLIGWMVGSTAPGQVVFSNWDYSVIDPSVGQAYTTRIKAAATTSSVLKEAGDIVGMFLVGGAVIARVARAAAPTEWIDIATIGTGVNAKLWPMMQSQHASPARTFVKPRFVGGLV